MPESKSVSYSEEHLVNVLKQYYNEGEDALQNRKDTYDDAEKMFDMQFRNTELPDDTIYYPTAHNNGAQIQRAIAQTFIGSRDILRVKPRYSGASQEEGIIAKAQNKILNASINDQIFMNKTVFIDKTSLQGVIYGAPHGYVKWEREVVEEPVYEDRNVVDEDTGIMERKRVQVGTRKRITENRLRFGHVEENDLLWDTNADKTGMWEDVSWVMRINIRKTANELRDMIYTEGFNESAVNDLIEHGASDSHYDDNDSTEPHRAEDNRTFNLVEFYGYIKLKPEDVEKTFVKIVAEQDTWEILLEPKNGKDYIPTDLKGNPMIPYQVGYLYPKDDSIVGESLMLIAEGLMKEENAMRNAIRKSAENDLHSVWVAKRGSGMDVDKLKNRSQDVVVWSDDVDARQALQEYPHKNTVGSGFGDLDILRRDWQMTYGNTDYTMGINDPSITDTASGIYQMTNAANTIVYFYISRYAETFLEPLLYKGLVMAIKYLTPQQLVSMGIDKEFATWENREKLFNAMRLSINTERGATSKMAKIKQKTQVYFLLQQAVGYCAKVGLVIPPEMMYAPINVLRDLLELHGEENALGMIPGVKRIQDLSQKRFNAQKKQQQQQSAERRQIIQTLIENADRAGYEGAVEELIQQEMGGGQQEGGSQ